MSYILDALRKSEHERQMSAGLGAGLLYPVALKRNHYPRFIFAIFFLVAFIIAALWWLWPQTTTPTANIVSPTPASRLPATVTEPPSPDPAPVAKSRHAAPEISQKKSRIMPHVEPRQLLATQIAPTAAAPLAARKADNVDPLQGLPALNISGYIHNEQGESLAMINNQLVHEGEEILPGLLLVKILDGSAIFSYKGYVFTR